MLEASKKKLLGNYRKYHNDKYARQDNLVLSNELVGLTNTNLGNRESDVHHVFHIKYAKIFGNN